MNGKSTRTGTQQNVWLKGLEGRWKEEIEGLLPKGRTYSCMHSAVAQDMKVPSMTDSHSLKRAHPSTTDREISFLQLEPQDSQDLPSRTENLIEALRNFIMD